MARLEDSLRSAPASVRRGPERPEDTTGQHGRFEKIGPVDAVHGKLGRTSPRMAMYRWSGQNNSSSRGRFGQEAQHHVQTAKERHLAQGLKSRKRFPFGVVGLSTDEWNEKSGISADPFGVAIDLDDEPERLFPALCESGDHGPANPLIAS